MLFINSTRWKLLLMTVGIFVFSGLQGQTDDTQTNNSSFFISGGLNYSVPHGSTKLVRGSRKVVTTNFSGSTSYTVKFGKRLNQRTALSISVGYANYVYENKEDFTDGFKNYSSDNFNYIPVFINLDKFSRKWGMDMIFGFHGGLVLYAKEVNLLSELHLLAIPFEDWPPHPDTLSPLDLEIANDIGLGVHASVRKSFSRLYLELTTSVTYAPFSAKILNDFEDDGDDDVSLKTNPFDIGLHIGYRF